MSNSRSFDFDKYAGIFKALGHPVRLRMAVGLSHHECNVNKIVEQLGLPQSTVSQHLAVLKNRGIVLPRKEGVCTCYRVVDNRVKRILEHLTMPGVNK